jgi:hypothetical protein
MRIAVAASAVALTGALAGLERRGHHDPPLGGPTALSSACVVEAVRSDRREVAGHPGDGGHHGPPTSPSSISPLVEARSNNGRTMRASGRPAPRRAARRTRPWVRSRPEPGPRGPPRAKRPNDIATPGVTECMLKARRSRSSSADASSRRWSGPMPSSPGVPLAIDRCRDHRGVSRLRNDHRFVMAHRPQGENRR